MEHSDDLHRIPPLRRHLQAVRSGFAAPEVLEPRPPDALAVGELAGDDFARSQLDLFTTLIEAVGSADALWCLDGARLPDEAFDWSSVEPGDVEFVEQVLAASDECCRLVLDTEFRTITRRILARVAERDPRPLRRSKHAARCAASLVWLACEANAAFGWGRRRSAAWIWSWFGVGNCSDRGRSLYRAAGLEPEDGMSRDGPMPLGDPSLLHSSFRATLVVQRDHMLEIAARRRTWSVTATDGNKLSVEVRARPTSVVHAVKGIRTDSGRAEVFIGFGERVEDADFVALTVPDAHELVRRVQLALDAGLPKLSGA